MIIPGAEIIIGLFTNVLVWMVLAFARAFVRAVRCCWFEHPGLTLLVLVGSDQLGWLISFFGPATVEWYPLIVGVLLCTFIARFFGEHPPTGIPREIHRLRREITGYLKADAVKESIERRLEARRRPPPPVPPPHEHIEDTARPRRDRSDVIDVSEAAPSSNGHGPATPEVIHLGPAVEVTS